MRAQERIHALVAPLVAARDLDLYDLEVGGGVLKVTVDREGGVDLDHLASLTRSISRALDESDPIEGRYTLEVTTPGLERPLRTPQHFGRARGETVKIKLRSDAEGDRRFEGTISTSDEEAVTVRLADSTERTMRYEEIDRARTVFVWGPSAKEKRNR